MREQAAVSLAAESWRSYLSHTRPKSWAPAFLFAATGYLLEPSLKTTAQIAADLGALFVVYSIFLWGGTSAYNSSQDHDDGQPLNYLENPPPIPRGLANFGNILMWAAIPAAAVFWGPKAAILAAIAHLFSILYSKRWPGLAFRGKETGLLDNLINASGCGWIAIYLGWIASSGGDISGAHPIALAFTLSVFATYPATQIHQMKATDTYADAKNYTSLLGPANALRAAALLLTAAWIVLLSQVYRNLLQDSFAALFVAFSFVYLSGAMQCWYWAREPFVESKTKFVRLVQLMLISRILFIVAVNIAR
ncbi:MAG: hypothetical protein ABL958_09055 [Bdellovibrionia bacterium]